MPLQSVLFGLYATFVVHVCQRLIEHASSAIDPSSRRVNVSQAAMCIGCMVWSLDVVGFFMYPELALDDFRLTPALTALLIMTISARVAVPFLSTSISSLRVGAAGLGLSAFMVGAHVVLSSGWASGPSTVNLFAVVFALTTAALIAVVLSLRHRVARMGVLRAEFCPLSWRDKVMAGAAIVPLHCFLVNTFPLPLDPSGKSEQSLALLVTALVFGIAIAADTQNNLRSERIRRHVLSRAFALVRRTAEPATQQQELQLVLIGDKLSQLLSRTHLVLYFQPIVGFQGGVTYQEALLRVNDEQLGAINPEAFFLACELQGKTSIADRMIIGIALDHARSWRQGGMIDPIITVNVAPATLLDRNFPAWLAAELLVRELPHTTLKLELTEHAIISSGEAMVDAISTLKASRIGVVMDDFGAGYSSLGILADLPIAGIKCDRLFLKELQWDLRRQALLRHIAALGRDLNISVIAEGVETREEMAIVMGSGIHTIQGYLFARPMQAQEIPAWHRQRQAVIAATPA